MRPSRIHIVITLLLLLVFIFWAIPAAANFAIEYNWWKEIGQIPTWFSTLWNRTTPMALGTLVAFLSLYLALPADCTSPAFARGMSACIPA